MKARWLLFFVLLLTLVCGCSRRKEILPGPEAAVLKTITASAYSLVVPEGGAVELEFTVSDAAYKFNYSVGSSGCQVKLLAPGGREPEEVYLKSVAPSSVQGTYIAVMADAGTGTRYETKASIAIVVEQADTGAETIVKSAGISFIAEYDPLKKVSRTGLPVVYMNTADGRDITSKSEYVNGNVTIVGTEELPGLATAKCRLRGRGNTTWTWPKKPYLIAFDEQQGIFGMHKHKRWVLLANFMDRTLMRNMVSMKVSSLMTHLDWTPGCVPVELVLNGVHQGTYLLTEQVRVDKNRVNITKDGGYLFELDFHYDNPVQWTDPHGSCWGVQGGIPFSIKHPDSEEVTQQQITEARDYITEVASVIYGDNFADPEMGYAKYLDVDSFIDYWIVFEVMTNHELNNPGSVFFHKDVDGLLTAGPCWDFDWGVLSFRTSPQGEYGLVCGDAIWYSQLFKDPVFKEKVKKRFLELKPQLESIPDYMEECRALLSESAKLNFSMWNPADDRMSNGGQIINGDENLSFNSAVDRLKDNYKKHLAIVESKL